MSTRVTGGLTFTNNSDVNFRIWATELDAAIIAAGWVDNNDTGSVTISALVVPAAGVSAGFRVYKMNDALAASSPCYMKVEFTTDSGSSGVPGLYITIGTGTNGSGTLTGNVSTRQHLKANGNYTTAVSFAYSSGSTSRFGFFMGIPGDTANPSPKFFISVSRFQDENGADTAEGFVLVLAWKSANGVGTASTIQFVPKLGGNFATQAQLADNWYGVYPRSGGSLSGDGFGLWPLIPVIGRPYPANYQIGLAVLTDLPKLEQISFTVNGITRTWLALGDPLSTAMTNSPCIMMRWE